MPHHQDTAPNDGTAAPKYRFRTRRLLRSLTATGATLMGLAGACQVDRGDLSFDADGFGDLGGMGGETVGVGGSGDGDGDTMGDGDGARGGNGGAPSGELPRAGIHFDNGEIGVGAVEQLTDGPLFTELTDSVQLTYPYDAREPAATPVATEIAVRATCSETTYNVTANPLGFLLYGVDSSTVWPGALLQGADYAEGMLSVLEVPPESRQPVSLSVKMAFGDREFVLQDVDAPSEQSLGTAISAVIASDFNDDVVYSGGNVHVDMLETTEVSRLLLGLGLSARIGTAEETIEASVNDDDHHHTVIVHLVEELFEAEAHAPQAPESWFSQDFFGDGLLGLQEAGDISEENPPVYVASVTYGRMLTFALTSTASVGEMSGALRAAAETLEDGGDFAGEAHLAKILEESEFSFLNLGGRGVVATIKGGNWGTFLSDNLKLSSAVPIRAELRNLADNTATGVTEMASFDERHCTPMMAVPGPFDFGFADRVLLSDDFESIEEVVSVDLDGDGAEDLVLNHRLGNVNSVAVVYGGGSQLTAQEAVCADEICDLSGDNVSWEDYQLFAADFTGDGRADLLWVPTKEHVLELGYSFHLLRGTESGFESDLESMVFEVGGAPLNAHPPLARDMNGDGVMDVIYSFINRNQSNQTIQDYQIILADPASDEGPFTLLPLEGGPGATDVNYPTTPLHFEVHDIDQDGHNDPIWNMLGRATTTGCTGPCYNVTMYRFNAGTNPPLFPTDTGKAFSHSSQGGWTNYLPLHGDFNGDQDTDTVFLRPLGTTIPIHQTYSENRTIAQGKLQYWPEADPGDGSLLPSHIFAGSQRALEVMNPNGDVPEDVVTAAYLDSNYDTAGELTLNTLSVLPGRVQDDDKILESGFFQTDLQPQVHPVTHDWSGYDQHAVADINGDGRDDFIWINSTTGHVYVAFGKPDALN